MTTANEENSTSLLAEIARLRGRIAELEQAEIELARLREEAGALRASEAELKAMFEAMTDVVLVLNGEGRYLKIAQTAPDLLYRPQQELIGKTLHEVMPPMAADFFMTHIGQALQKRRVVTIDYTLPIEGREVFFTANISPMSENTVIVVARDISERKLAEQAVREKAEQEQQLRAQEAALVELSTPLIPISDDVVVMPLIGVIDARRAERIMQTLLEGITGRGARMAILDITGVAVVDTHVANGLITAARAAQLLGAQIILTGIRPEVAQTLVTLGADLTGITTLGTLQSGIAHAMSGARQYRR